MQVILIVYLAELGVQRRMGMRHVIRQSTYSGGLSMGSVTRPTPVDGLVAVCTSPRRAFDKSLLTVPASCEAATKT